MRKFNFKTILILALVLVFVLSVGLVACNKKTEKPSELEPTPFTPSGPGSDDPADSGEDDEPKENAIIYVTALFGGGLYNQETNEPIWDPFKTEFDLYDHWAEDVLERLECFKNGEEYTGDSSKSTIYDFAGVLGEFEEEMGDAFDVIVKALTFKEGTLLYDMTLDQDGNGYNPNVVPANNQPKDENGNLLHCYYGAVAIYKKFITETKKQFGDDYDCVMFNQDWRKSPADSAKVLEDFINEKGYKKVILMSHSMGGPVVNSYLGRSQTNRDKVQLYLAFAPATLGSFDAFGAITCPTDYLSSFLTTFGFDFTELLSQQNGLVRSIIKNMLELIGIFFNNNWGMMALCPSFEFINSYQLAGDSLGGLYVNGDKIGIPDDPNDPDSVEEAKNELYEFYNTLGWALYYDTQTETNEDGEEIVHNLVIHYEDGEELEDGNIVRIVEGMDIKNGDIDVTNFDAVKDVLVDCETLCFEKAGKLTVQTDVNGYPICVNTRGDRIKYGAARLKTYYEGLYVKNEYGQDVIAMSQVNAYTFLGTDIRSTITGVRMTVKKNDKGKDVLDENGYPVYVCEIIHDDLADVGEEGWIGGDGMVCSYASLAGQDPEALKRAGRLFIYEGFWHADVGGAWPLLGDKVIELMSGVINK